MGSRLDYWRNEILYRGSDVQQHPGRERALSKTERLAARGVHYCVPRYDVAVAEFEQYLGVRDEELVSHSLNDIRHAGLCAIGLSVMSWPPLAVQCLCSNVLVAYRLQPRAWIVWVVWWLNGSRCPNGSSFSPSQRTFHFSWRRSSSTILGRNGEDQLQCTLRNVRHTLLWSSGSAQQLHGTSAWARTGSRDRQPSEEANAFHCVLQQHCSHSMLSKAQLSSSRESHTPPSSSLSSRHEMFFVTD